jgi:glutamine amidotransferase
VNYGVGNLRSVKRGIERSGAKVLITHDQKDLIESDAIVLPGVGAFTEAVRNMSPLSGILIQSVKDGKPLFGICLGLQLLFTRSYEGEPTDGLDLISGDIVKLPDSVKIPQMGWNTIKIVQPHPLLEGIQDDIYVYFVHTYIPQPSEEGVIVATTEYGVKFPSVIAKKSIFAAQFHPEKSSKAGLTMLRNFVKIVKR